MEISWIVMRGHEKVADCETADEAIDIARRLSLVSISTLHVMRCEITHAVKVKGGDVMLPAGVTERPTGRDGYGDKGYAS